MIGAALADVHLGFVGAGRTVGVRNQRELDVEAAWEAAITNILAEPHVDLVTIAGDVFDRPSASMHAVLAFRRGVARLVRAGIPVIVAQGNHDAGRTDATATPILVPDDYPGVYVVTEPTRISLEVARTGERCSVAVFPFVCRGTGEAYRVEPDPTADVNLLLVHAAVRGAAEGATLPHFYGGGGAALDVAREAGRWDVVAVGDYHEFTRLHPEALAFYSGSIEHTSSNIWAETQPKGVVLYDTAAREMRLVTHPTRPMFDLSFNESMFADCGPSAKALNDALGNLASDIDLEDALVRLRVESFPCEECGKVDSALTRQLKQRCVHFLLDLHVAARDIALATDRRVGERRSVEADFRAFAVDAPQDVVDLALRHLAAAAAESPELEEVPS